MKTKIIKTLVLAIFALFFVSCENLNVRSYTVDGSGLDWKENPVQVVDAKNVQPNVTIIVPKTGMELTGAIDFSRSKEVDNAK